MASVKRFPNSANWYACYSLDGKRVQRSTGLTDRDQALQLALSYERAATSAVAREWTQRSAQKFLKEVAAIAGIELGAVESTSTFLRRWLRSRKTTTGEGTFERYSGVIDDFLMFIGPMAGAPILEITPSKVAAFRDAEIEAGKSPTTVNKALMILGQAFAEAVTLRVLEHNPARGLNVKGAKRATQKRRAFTFEQFRQLVRVTAPTWNPPGRQLWKNQVLSADWQTFIVLLGYTGGRQQEVAQLRWRQIDLKRGLATLERTKTGDEHWIPLHPALLSHLKTKKVGKPDDFVLPEISQIQRRHLSNKFRLSVLPRIGIAQAYSKDGGKGRRLAEYSLHSLRHSLSTWLNAAGVSEMNRMRIVGHENEEVSRGYTHTELDQIAAELGKVADVFAVPAG